jgi:hypothetical protein
MQGCDPDRIGKENILRRRFKDEEKHIINRNAVYFPFLFLLMFSASFCLGASNNGTSTVRLNDWKFYFAGKDSSVSYGDVIAVNEYFGRELASLGNMPVGLNACGVVTRDREKKLSWEIVRQRYDFFRKQFAERQE